MGGTAVEVVAENVPAGISTEDHRVGMESSLANLARLVEDDPAALGGPAAKLTPGENSR